MTEPPLSTVFHWAREVESYLAAGKKVEVPRLPCPECQTPMGFWGWYRRGLRRLLKELAEALTVGEEWIWVRRARCPGCARTHAVLPDFCHEWRQEEVGVIGEVLSAVEKKEQAAVHVAARLGLPAKRVQNLVRRYRQRLEVLWQGYSHLALELGGEFRQLPAEMAKAVLMAVTESWQQARRRWGEARVGGLWQWWSRAAGGRPLGLRPPTFWGAARSP